MKRETRVWRVVDRNILYALAAVEIRQGSEIAQIGSTLQLYVDVYRLQVRLIIKIHIWRCFIDKNLSLVIKCYRLKYWNFIKIFSTQKYHVFIKWNISTSINKSFEYLDTKSKERENLSCDSAIYFTISWTKN